VDSLLTKDQKKRPSVEDIFKMEFVKERMKLYGYNLEEH
jgi:hypothetical protein